MKKMKADLDRKGEQGAAMVFVVICLATLLAVAALVIDLNFAATSKEQAEHYTRLAALASIESYFESISAGSSVPHTRAFSESVRRANEVSQTNRVLASSGLTPSMRATDSSEAATVEVGHWRVDVPTITTPCANASKTSPCFIQCVNNDCAGETPNAFKVVGPIYSSGVSTKMARSIFGVSKIPLRTSAIATIVPRRGCFLIDNSGSMTRETHIDQKDEFAFYLKSDNHPTAACSFTSDTGLTIHDQIWHGSSDTSTPVCTNLPSTLSGFTPVKERTRDDAFNVFRSSEEYVQSHYGDDYKQILTLGDAHYPQLSAAERRLHPNPAERVGGEELYHTHDAAGSLYRVDLFRKGVGGSPPYSYEGPSPLRTVFAGLRRAIELYKNRRVAGDKACLIFYDQTLAWPRVIKLTDNFDYLLSLTDFDNMEGVEDFAGDALGEADFVGNKVTPYFNNPSPGILRLLRYGLFPGRNAQTNLGQALQEAVNQFSIPPPPIPTADFVVFIGDGLTNCVSKNDCKDDFAHYKSSVQNLESLVADSAGRSVPLHFIGVGQKIQPHTIDLPKPEGTGCYSDEEWRALKKPAGTDPYSFAFNGVGDLSSTQSALDSTVVQDSYSSTAPFYYSNYQMYKWASQTGGVWGPIRPPRAKVAGSCPPVNCRNPSDPDVKNIDGKQLRFRDPDCHTEDEQIQGYMGRILRDNPFTIVEVNDQLG